MRNVFLSSLWKEWPQTHQASISYTGPVERPPSGAEEAPPRPSLYRRILRRLASYWARPQDGEQHVIKDWKPWSVRGCLKQTPRSVSETGLEWEKPFKHHWTQLSVCHRAGPSTHSVHEWECSVLFGQTTAVSATDLYVILAVLVGMF